MRRVGSHPVEARLSQVKDLDPAERLDVIWDWYEDECGGQLSRPPTESERAAVHRWLLLGRRESGFPHFGVLEHCPRPLLALSSTELAGSLNAEICPKCEVVGSERHSGLHFSMMINIDPWSAQSTANARQVQDLVREEMRRNNWLTPYRDGPLCVSVVSLLGTSGRDKDVDNLVKGLLDSLEGVVYEKDGQIQCLSSRKIAYSGKVGAYFLKVRSVRPYSEYIVYDSPEASKSTAGHRIDRHQQV